MRGVQENGFILTPEAIEAAVTPKTKAIVLAYPNNPTGGIMTKEQLEAIAPVIEKHDLLVISDEIYAERMAAGTFPLRRCRVCASVRWSSTAFPRRSP